MHPLQRHQVTYNARLFGGVAGLALEAFKGGLRDFFGFGFAALVIQYSEELSARFGLGLAEGLAATFRTLAARHLIEVGFSLVCVVH